MESYMFQLIYIQWFLRYINYNHKIQDGFY